MSVAMGAIGCAPPRAELSAVRRTMLHLMHLRASAQCSIMLDAEQAAPAPTDLYMPEGLRTGIREA